MASKTRTLIPEGLHGNGATLLARTLKARGMSQTEAASILGYSQTSISLWLSRARIPDLPAALYLQKLLGIDPREWLTAGQMDRLEGMDQGEPVEGQQMPPLLRALADSDLDPTDRAVALLVFTLSRAGDAPLSHLDYLADQAGLAMWALEGSLERIKETGVMAVIERELEKE